MSKCICLTIKRIFDDVKIIHTARDPVECALDYHVNQLVSIILNHVLLKQSQSPEVRVVVFLGSSDGPFPVEGFQIVKLFQIPGFIGL